MYMKMRISIVFNFCSAFHTIDYTVRTVCQHCCCFFAVIVVYWFAVQHVEPGSLIYATRRRLLFVAFRLPELSSLSESVPKDFLGSHLFALCRCRRRRHRRRLCQAAARLRRLFE